MEVFNIVKIILVLVLFGYSVWELVNKLKKQQKQLWKQFILSLVQYQYPFYS